MVIVLVLTITYTYTLLATRCPEVRHQCYEMIVAVTIMTLTPRLVSSDYYHRHPWSTTANTNMLSVVVTLSTLTTLFTDTRLPSVSRLDLMMIIVAVAVTIAATATANAASLCDRRWMTMINNNGGSDNGTTHVVAFTIYRASVVALMLT